MLGRRVDPVTRRVSPAVTSLALQPHSFGLTIEQVTPNLLAREEKERERSVREECEREKKDERRRESLKRPHEADEADNDVESNGARAEKRMKVLHPTAPTAPEEGERTASAQGTAVGDGEEKAKPDTALVRLSSGRVVRVPIEILRQHQEQVKARRDQQLQQQQQQQQQHQHQQQQPQLQRHTNGVARIGLQNADQALSRVLARISPAAMPTGQRVVRAIPPTVIRQIAPQITLAPHHQAKASSPDTIVNNGIRLPQRQALQQQRVVRIRAYPGPPGASGNIPLGLAPTMLTAPNGAAKLSDRLNLIEPLVQTHIQQKQYQPQQHRVVTTATSAAGQPLRVRCYPGASTIRSVLPVTSAADPSHQRLSVALNSVTGHQIQAVVPVSAGTGVAHGVQKSVVAPVERVIVLGPRPTAAGQVIKQQQNGQQPLQHHRVQLAPIFARQVATSSKQGTQQQQQQQLQTVVIQGPDGTSTTAVAASESMGSSAPRRNVRLVELVQQQPGGGGGGGSKGGQLVALGGGQIVRATAATLANASATVPPPSASALLRNSGASLRTQTVVPPGNNMNVPSPTGAGSRSSQ